MKGIWLGFIVVGMQVAPAPADAQAPEGGRSEIGAVERVYWLSKLWQEVDYNFAYFDQIPDLDFDAHYRSCIPRVLQADTDFEYYRLLQRFLAALRDGHTMIVYPWSMRQQPPIDFPWVQLREVDRRAIVENVDRTLADRLPPGSEVIHVDGETVSARLERDVFPRMSVSTEHVKWRDGIRGSARHMYGLLAGPAGSTARIGFLTPDGHADSIAMVRDRATREGGWLVQTQAEPVLEHRDLGDGIAYVALSTFNDTALVGRFDAIMPALMQARAVVLDLRRNGGGMDDVAKAILSRMTSTPLPGPAWNTRRHVATFKAWGVFADEDDWAEQYRPYLDGDVWHHVPSDTVMPGDEPRLAVPLAVLIGEETESSAKNFLIYLDSRPCVAIIGQPTVGSSGQPLFIDLPLGGRAWIVTKRNTYPDGRTYIGTGVVPHQHIRVTVEDIRRAGTRSWPPRSRRCLNGSATRAHTGSPACWGGRPPHQRKCPTMEFPTGVLHHSSSRSPVRSSTHAPESQSRSAMAGAA